MTMKSALLAGCLLCTAPAWSQSKVFKEVSDEISSQMKIISQDEALIGYLVFSQLEKASKDSFNYQVSIMDENLNDIGKVTFREKNLELQAVSFDQDVLCLAYLKSDLTDLKGINMRKIQNAIYADKNAVFTQLVNLQGEIIYSGSQKVELRLKDDIAAAKASRPSTIPGRLQHPVILKNIPGKGFALFYGDERANRLTAIDVAGKELWQKRVDDAQAYGMLTTATDVYLLSKKKHQKEEGGFDLRGYSAKNGTAYEKYDLKDKKGNQLKVLSFEHDPATGRPLITGTIINNSRGNDYYSVQGLHKGAYDGVFTLSVNGPGKANIRERFSYWKDGSKAPEIKTNGSLSERRLYPRYTTTVQDYQGNTYFVGSSYIRKTRVGGIVAGVLTAPLLVPTVILWSPGFHKTRQSDVVLLRQDTTGTIRYENAIEAADSRFVAARANFGYFNSRSFYSVSNATTKSNFLIVDEPKSATIYNVEKRKVVRQVPHREGGVSTYIYPAKEGHIMVMEYNRKAKETKLSIEALQ